MALYNNRTAGKIDSAAMKATGTDCLSDMASTAVVLICSLIGHFTGLALDGYCGLAVSALILFAGYSAAKDTLGPLLGQAPEPEFIQKIQRIVLIRLKAIPLIISDQLEHIPVIRNDITAVFLPVNSELSD